MSTAASVLDQRLSQLIGDWIEETVTTAISNTALVVCTTLNEWDDGSSASFKGHWCYITDEENIGEDRKVYAYDPTTGGLSVRGAVFATDTAETATFRLYKYSYTAKLRAINDAIRELSSVLFRKIDDRSLVTGSILPDGHLEDWTNSTSLRFYATDNAATVTLTQSTSNIRGARGTIACNVKATADNGFMRIDSDDYPRLLDLMGKTVTFRAWAYPEVANDASIVAYTLKSDGTTNQVLTSSTANPAGAWTLLELEDQVLNDDLVKIEIRSKVATNTKYALFDNERVTGRSVREYLLPDAFQDGDVAQVYIQSSGYSDVACDDLMPVSWDRIWGSTFFHDGTYKYIRLPATYPINRQIRLIGTAPLSTLSTFAGTTEIDGKYVDLLVAYAAYCLFRNEEGVPSSEDTGRYRSRAMKWLGEYERLKPNLRMIKPSGTLLLPRP